MALIRIAKQEDKWTNLKNKRQDIIIQDNES